MSEQTCRYPCDCGQFPEEHCACMEGHGRKVDSAKKGLPDALHLCSTDCPEPCPHVWYPEFLPAALRVLSYDSGLQREADLAVGWDYGPEQGAWLRSLADALEARAKGSCDHAPEHVTSDGLRWPLTCDACRDERVVKK